MHSLLCHDTLGNDSLFYLVHLQVASEGFLSSSHSDYINVIDLVVVDRNKDFVDDLTIDLHALHVKEAIRFLKLHLRSLSSISCESCYSCVLCTI